MNSLPLPTRARATPSPVMIGVLALTSVLAIAVPVAIVGTADWRPTAARKLNMPRAKIVPPSQVPAVEPVAYAPVTPADAVAFNAAIPFSTAPNPPARPFRLADTPAALDRAVDCLAAAQLYEAGDDAEGERAVAQVVINRVRHPAFPKSICGVVFEGAERPTGCQFTFTCDGALARHRFSDAAWATARLIARAALSGAVYKPVGHATHYHTNWVVPYWSASLDKVTAVGTHLFFRWTGWWGTPGAFTRTVTPDEPVITAMASYSPAHRAALELQAPGIAADRALAAGLKIAPPLAGDSDTIIATLDTTISLADLPAIAAAKCGDRAYCKFMAWRSTGASATPTKLPLAIEEIRSMAFSYRRDQKLGIERSLWNCTVYPRSDRRDCMKPQLIDDNGASAIAAKPELLSAKPQLLVPKPELIRPGTKTPTSPGPGAEPGPQATPLSAPRR